MAGRTTSRMSVCRALSGAASALTLALLLSGCSDTTDPGAPAASAIVNEQEWLNVNFLVFVPCAAGGAGEDVLFSGRLHTFFHSNVNGVRFVLKDHAQPAAIKGTGLVTGTQYRAVGMSQISQADVGANLLGTYTNVFFMVGRGPDNNFQVHELFHVVQDPVTLDVRVIIDNFSVVCGADGGN